MIPINITITSVGVQERSVMNIFAPPLESASFVFLYIIYSCDSRADLPRSVRQLSAKLVFLLNFILTSSSNLAVELSPTRFRKNHGLIPVRLADLVENFAVILRLSRISQKPRGS